MRFKLFRQLELTDCGSACVKMIAYYYRRKYPLRYISQSINMSRIGVTVADIKCVSEQLGLKAIVAQGMVAQLEKLKQPVILHWRGNHFVVLYKVKLHKKKRTFYIADFSHGFMKFEEEEFKKHWCTKSNVGYIIISRPTTEFYSHPEVKEEDNFVVLRQLVHKISGQ